MIDNVFLKEGAKPKSATNTKKPDPPVIAAVAVVPDSTSLFAAADAGVYYYVVTAENEFGESAISNAITITAITANRSPITITKAGTGAIPTGYKVYRSQKGAASAADVRLMTRIPLTGSPLTFNDLNKDLPGTGNAFLLTTDPIYQAIEYLEFLPLQEFKLFPTQAAVDPFLLLMVGTLGMKIPKRHIMYKNVGNSSLSWY